jgi:iron(II)-dependent oxidoreductase
MKPYYIDATQVTQADFAAYLKQHPDKLSTDRYHYLKHFDWSDPSMPKPYPGNETLPVTYIGYAEAEAYCASVGKRLPSELEWQYAGQGNRTGANGEPILFPWGDTNNASLYPKTTTGNIFTRPEPVDKYSPAGDSAFGVKGMAGEKTAPFVHVLDIMIVLPKQARDKHRENSKKCIVFMAGNAWDMTSVFEDDHTRSVILRGSSNYRPSGSHWYFPLTPSFLGQHEKCECERLAPSSL